MNALLRSLAGIAALTLLVACGDARSDARPDGDAEAAVDAELLFAGHVSVDLAVATARAIRDRPAATDSILRVRGLTPAGFDSLLFRIAADPELARFYTQAMN